METMSQDIFSCIISQKQILLFGIGTLCSFIGSLTVFIGWLIKHILKKSDEREKRFLTLVDRTMLLLNEKMNSIQEGNKYQRKEHKEEIIPITNRNSIKIDQIISLVKEIQNKINKN